MPSLRSIYMFPLWFIQIFTQTKSFRSNPIIGSTRLNRLGLHTARIRCAHMFATWRRFFLKPIAPKEIREQYHRDGYVAVENFLSDADFEKLKKEILTGSGDMREMQQGDTLTQMLLLDKEAQAKFPACSAFLSDKRLINYTSYIGSFWARPVSFIHCIKNGFGKQARGADPQKTLHTDTFHATVKYWLFLDDVPTGEGPFVYVPGSHKLDAKRLDWEYKMSSQPYDQLDHHSAVGSLRMSDEDLSAMGYEAKEMTVPANTLVMANTFGFHRRGDVDQPCSRLAIFGSSRLSPFNPWPGLASKWFLQIQHFGARKIWEMADARAAKANAKPGWQLVPLSHIHKSPDDLN